MAEQEKVNVEEQDVMRVTEHLKELRNRIIVVVVAFLASVVIAFNYSEGIVQYLVDIGIRYGYQFVYLTPSELFMQYVRIAVITGVVIIVPVIFYEVWAFIRPGLKKNENTIVFIAMLMGLGFFVLGTLFALYIVVPFMLGFYFNINSIGDIGTSISVANYISFLMSNFLCFGVIFELPVVTTLLTQLGLIKYEWLSKFRKIVIVLIFVIAAIITPPDVVSQLLCAGPMVLLFEVSIQISRVIGLRKKRKEESEE